MVLPDVNVLIYAHREELAHHAICKSWLKETLQSSRAFGTSDIVLSGFLRVVTNARAFPLPTPLEQALAFIQTIRDQPHCVPVAPGDRHWEIFTRLCRAVNATGNLVPDAWLAALAIESGSEWITTDRGFGGFPGLKWRHPLA